MLLATWAEVNNSQKQIRQRRIYYPPPPHHHHHHLYRTWRRGRWAPPPSGLSSSPSRAPCGQTRWKIIILSKNKFWPLWLKTSLLARLPPRKNHTCYTAIHYIGPTGPWAFKLILEPKQHQLINWLRYNYRGAPPGQHDPLLAEFASDPGNICLKLCWVFAPFAHTPEVPV